MMRSKLRRDRGQRGIASHQNSLGMGVRSMHNTLSFNNSPILHRTYSSSETCLILKGKVTVTPDGGAPVEISAGDYVVFPAGMKCTWEVTLQKCNIIYFKFEDKVNPLLFRFTNMSRSITTSLRI